MTTTPHSSLMKQIRLYWRFFLIILHVLIGMVLAILVGAAFVQHKPFQQPVIRWWHSRLCRILGIKIRVHGKPVNHAALWISNHVSWLDIPVIGSQYRVHFLSKAEVAEWPFVGWLARIAGTLFIKRGSGDAGKVSNQLGFHLANNRSILFFPEGTTTDGFTVKRLFSKLFSAAIDTDCTIQPMVLCYHNDQGLHPFAPFIGDATFFGHALTILKCNDIKVDLVILPAEKVNGRNTKELAKYFEELMANAVKELHGHDERPLYADSE